ncbi:MAG: prepilin-type N-terminal cleavage/methylation domain-containing protein [Cyanobacteria bacterium J06639_1]
MLFDKTRLHKAGISVVLTRASEGFTLLEMLSAIAILGIAAAISIPAGARLFQRFELDAAQSELLQAMRTAQVNAQRYSERWGVDVVNVSGSMRVRAMPVNASDNLDPTRCAQKSCLEYFAVSSVQEVSPGAAFSNSVATFNSRGELDELTGRFFRIQSKSSALTERCVVATSLLGGLRAIEEGQSPCL